jgi:orotate phosphoribosyltransferase
MASTTAADLSRARPPAYMAVRMDDDKRKTLLELLARHSYIERELTLASGRHSNYYIDCKRTLYLPIGARLAGELMLDLVLARGVKQVGGLAAGALPVTDAIIVAASYRGADLRGFFVRKETKAHGLQQRIEGAFDPGLAAGVIDDTITTGGSTLAALGALRDAGASVSAAFALVDRGEGAGDVFAGEGLVYSYLFSAEEVRRAARG